MAGLFEASLYVAFAMRKDKKQDIALLIDKSGAIASAAQDDRKNPEDAHTACINLLQTRTGPGNVIVTTAVPTQACRGMALNGGISAIHFLRMGQLKRIELHSRSGIWTETTGGAPKGDKLLAALPSIPNFYKSSTSDGKRSDDADQWYQGLLNQMLTGDSATFFNSAKAWKAKVSKRQNPGPVYADPPTVDEVPEMKDTPYSRQLFMALVYAIAGKCFSKYSLDHKVTKMGDGNNIASLLVGSKNQLLAWGRNKGSTHATWHGETGLIQAYQAKNGGQELPPGCRLYTTLEPCFMCAGVITHTGTGVEVFYGHKDPGISNSSLEKRHNGCCQHHLPTIESLRIAEGHLKDLTPLKVGELTARSKSTANLDLLDLSLRYLPKVKDLGVTTHLAGSDSETQFGVAEQRYLDMKPQDTNSPEYKVWKAGKDLLDIVS